MAAAEHVISPAFHPCPRDFVTFLLDNHSFVFTTYTPVSLLTSIDLIFKKEVNHNEICYT